MTVQDARSLEIADVNELLGRWWLNYDAGHFDVLAGLLTTDAHFTCRTDTGKTDFEDFVRADYRGRDAVMTWQTQHRIDSPDPLRHMGLNVHLTGPAGAGVGFASYLFVTHLVARAIANLSTAIVTGSAQVEAGALRLSSLHVVLDTRTSLLFKDR